MRSALCAVTIFSVATLKVVAAPTPSPTPFDENAALKEFAALDPETQKAALAFAKKKSGGSPAADNTKPIATASPPAGGSPPARPSSFAPLDPSKVPSFGKPSPATKAVEGPTIGSWLEHNIEIRNSFYDSKQVDSPAKISWTKNMDETAFYTVDAAIVGTMFAKHPSPWELFNQDVFVAVSPTFEAHISTENNTPTKHNSQDSLLYALPMTFTYGTKLSDSEISDWLKSPTVNDPGSKYRSSDWIEGGEFILNPAYRMDQDHSVDASEGGFYWKPGTWIPAGLNERKTLAKDFLTFRWDPTIGLEIGSYQKTTDLPVNIPRDYYRGFLRIHAEVGLGPEDRPPFTLTADYTLRDERSSPEAGYNYSEISVIYNVDPDRPEPVADAGNKPKIDPATGKVVNVNIPGHVKVGATWKHGKDVPLFMNADTFTAWIGVQF